MTTSIIAPSPRHRPTHRPLTRPVPHAAVDARWPTGAPVYSSRRGGIWPAWARLTRPRIIERATHVHAACQVAQVALADAQRQFDGQDGPQSDHAQTVIMHLSQVRAAALRGAVACGELELTLRQVEHDRPVAQTWPRHSRQLYGQLIDSALSAAPALHSVAAVLLVLLNALQSAQEALRATKTPAVRARRAQALQHALGDAAGRLPAIAALLDDASISALSIANALLSAEQHTTP